MTYIPGMRESSAGWLGRGQLVYSTTTQANTPFASNPTLQQLQKPYKDAQTQHRASQAADKALRQASRQGNVTVYDAAKRQYVSATPAEANAIQNANRELQTQRRAAQTKQLGRGNVTVFDASKGLHISATPQEAKLIEKANKRLAAINGLNERITAQMENTSKYGGKTVKSGGQFISITPEQVEAQAQRKALQIPKALGTGNVTVFDASKGLHISATPQEAKLIEKANQTLPEKALGETTKESKGIWGSIKSLFGKAKNALSSGWTKFKSFAKTPKGKWSLAAAAVVAVAAGIWAYVADRFSGKNNPTTVGPSKAFMPKLETEEDDTPEIETEVVEETDNDETKTDSTKVVPAPVGTDTDNETDEVTDADKTNKTDKIDETKTPATEEEKKEAEEVAKVNDTENKREPATVSGDEYEVVKGDCVWNIAKAHLKELNKDKADYTPSNVEILRHTKELMEINDLHYEADNYVVIIEPGQKLKLKK